MLPYLTHGNITNAGKIGTAANLPIITGTGGILQAGSFGTAANTFCQGNDSRLSNARTPTAHTQAISTITDLQTALDLKANLASPALSGTPTAPTAAAATNNTQIATTAFVANAVSAGFAANDAMVFKGTLGTGGSVTALPSAGYRNGWTYRVITGGTYAGHVCEVGDLILCVNDAAPFNNAWTVAQTNIEGAVISSAALTSSHLVEGNGGTSVKISSVATANVVTAASDFADNQIILGAGTNKTLKTSSKTISTTLTTNSDTQLPTSKAVYTYVNGAYQAKNTNLTNLSALFYCKRCTSL